MKCRLVILGLCSTFLLSSAIFSPLAFAGRIRDIPSSQNGFASNCDPNDPSHNSGTCLFFQKRGTVDLKGTDATGNPIDVTLTMSDWGNTDSTGNHISNVVFDIVLQGSEPTLNLTRFVMEGIQPNPSYVSCAGNSAAIRCNWAPMADGENLQEPTAIGGSDSNNTQWDFGATSSSDRFVDIQICDDPQVANCPGSVSGIGEAILAISGSFANDNLSLSTANYSAMVTDGAGNTFILGGLNRASPAPQATNNSRATAKVIETPFFQDYVDTSQLFPSEDPQGNMQSPTDFAIPPPPSCNPTIEATSKHDTRVFRTAWYTYTAPSGGSITVTTTGSHYDTLLYILTGNTEIACDDDSGAFLQAETSVSVTGGERYDVLIVHTPPEQTQDSSSGSLIGYPLSTDGSLFVDFQFTADASTDSPFGHVDSLNGTAIGNATTVGQGTVLTVAGWAVDPSDGAPVALVQMLIDGSVVAGATLGISRPDVAKFFNDARYANSGWTASYNIGNLATGSHVVTVMAYSAEGLRKGIGNQIQGIGSFTVNAPLGHVDSLNGIAIGSGITVGPGTVLTVAGWAADPQDGAPVTRVQILIDANPVADATLGLSRPDVAKFFNDARYTNSGWTANYNLGNLATGSHVVTAMAYDAEGITSQIQGIGTFTVNAPFGHVDSLNGIATGGVTTVGQGTVLTVVGWAADPQDGAPVIRVQMLIDGNAAADATLGLSRPDVAKFFNSARYTNSGWTASYNTGNLAAGGHVVTAVAYDAEGIATQIQGVGSFTVDGPPFGHVDSLNGIATGGVTTVGQGTVLTVVGWAADPQDGAPVTRVQMLIDGNAAADATLGLSRPDVAKFFNNARYTNSGWTANYNTSNLAAGGHVVTAVAYDAEGIANQIQGVGSFTVNTLPFGWIDTGGLGAVAEGGTLQFSGWAADKEDGSPVAKVQIVLDGTVVLGNAILGESRPDVASVFADTRYLNSGWSFTYVPSALAPGLHAVTAIAYDSQGAITQLQGTANFNFTNTPPFGWIDTGGLGAVAEGGTLQFSGWAADKEDGSPVAKVQIVLDGTVVLGNAILGESRPDVASVFADTRYLNSGWSFTYVPSALAPGLHAVTAIAYDSQGAIIQLQGAANFNID